MHRTVEGNDAVGRSRCCMHLPFDDMWNLFKQEGGTSAWSLIAMLWSFGTAWRWLVLPLRAKVIGLRIWNCTLKLRYDYHCSATVAMKFTTACYQ